jgi:hypothetical protein
VIPPAPSLVYCHTLPFPSRSHRPKEGISMLAQD